LLRNIFISTIISFTLVMTGCASLKTSTAQYKGTRELMEKRDIPAVIRKLETRKSKLYKNKDRVLEYLDLGMLYHYQGDYVKSNQLLEQAEQAMEELYTKSVSKAALSLLLNDNALDYFGEDYEDIYTNVFKALNYQHLNQFDDAFVEIRRINLKLAGLEDKYGRMADSLNTSRDSKAEITAGTNKFTSSALGSYLSMMLYEQEGLYDDAGIDYQKIREAFASQPDIYNFPLPALADSLRKTEETSLHVVALVGTSPYKVSRELHIATGQDLLAIASVDEEVAFAPIFWSGIESGYYFKFALPYIVNDTTIVGQVIVRINDRTYELQKLEDIGNVAVQTFKVREPIIYLKSITRAVLKGVAAEYAKQEMKKKNPGLAGDLMALAADVALYASENADLRTSRFFPNAVLVSDISLPPGQYNVSIDYYDKYGLLLYTDDKGTVTVSGNSLNLVESWNLQ
jgi:hypothetical protein